MFESSLTPANINYDTVIHDIPHAQTLLLSTRYYITTVRAFIFTYRDTVPDM